MRAGTARSRVVARAVGAPAARRRALSLLAGAILAASTLASDAQSGRAAVELAEAWIDLPRHGSSTTTAFVTLTNKTDSVVSLVAAESPDVKSIALTRAVPTEGGTGLRAIGVIAIPPRATLAMTAETYFLVLANLARPVADGDTLAVTLRFGDGSRISAPFRVRAPDRGAGADGN